MMRDRASFYKKKQQFLNYGLELNYGFTSDSASQGAQVSHLNISSQILLADGPQPPIEKAPCSKSFCISLRV